MTIEDEKYIRFACDVLQRDVEKLNKKIEESCVREEALKKELARATDYDEASYQADLKDSAVREDALKAELADKNLASKRLVSSLALLMSEIQRQCPPVLTVSIMAVVRDDVMLKSIADKDNVHRAQVVALMERAEKAEARELVEKQSAYKAWSCTEELIEKEARTAARLRETERLGWKMCAAFDGANDEGAFGDAQSDWRAFVPPPPPQESSK